MATAATIEPGTDIMLAVEETPQIVLLDSAKFDQFYERVKAETDALVPDLSTKKGREEIRSMAAKVTRSKTMIDKARLQLTAQWREQTSQVNAAGKEIEQRLDALADEVRKPLTEWEDAEKKRIEWCRSVIDSFKVGMIVTMDDTAETVRARGAAAWNVIISPDTFGDMLAEAEAAKELAVSTLKAALARLLKEEADRVELERLRAEAVERAEAERLATEEAAKAEAAKEAARREAEELAAYEERRLAAEKAEAERIEQAKQEAAETARREAEEAARKEREEAEQAKQAEIDAANERARQAEEAAQRQREEAERAERERIAAAKREAEEKAQREADQAHRTSVKTAAKTAIMSCGVDEEAARKIVTLIIAGEVPHVRMEF